MGKRTYIDQHGLLHRGSMFRVDDYQIHGVRVTELWGDAFKINAESVDGEVRVLIPGVNEYGLEVEDDWHKKAFIDRGGGFRLDWFITG